MQGIKGALTLSVNKMINFLTQNPLINSEEWEKCYHLMANLLLHNVLIDYEGLALLLLNCQVFPETEEEYLEYRRKVGHLREFLIILENVHENSPEYLNEADNYRILFAQAISNAIDHRRFV